jgi:alkylation response protein AidB-like acyl-CoA dehydrogenase
VFYDEVRIPVANIVGAMHDGWSVAMSTLAFERGTAFTANLVKLADTVERLIDEARTRAGPDGRRPAIADDEIARELARVRAEATAARSMTYLGISRNLRDPIPGPEGSILKLACAELEQRVQRLAIQIVGDDALRFDNAWTHNYLRSFAASIGGGTSEIQRNIIAERVLGLPR